MDSENTKVGAVYKVVVNDQQQHSIWPAGQENPLGWEDVGISGSKEECLAYIDRVWTDMRPLRLRKTMEAAESREPHGSA
jgi:MbtH protein